MYEQRSTGLRDPGVFWEPQVMFLRASKMSTGDEIREVRVLG